MTKSDFLEWMKKRNGKAGGWIVVVDGRIINKESITIWKGGEIGIRYADGKWQVYEPQERSADYIDIETTDENAAFDTLASLVEMKEEAYGGTTDK